MGIISKYAFAIVFFGSVSIVNGQNIKSQAGHEYVDLGLSVNWATCNIGASSPEEFGGYFAWGETDTKSCYNDMTYKFSGETHSLTKFKTIDAQIKAMTDYTKYLGDENKEVLNDSKLDIIDDVANVQWGKPWRMPTFKEIKELVDSCDWIFEEKAGVMGCWAISKVNGNKIFFPLAGYFQDDMIEDVGKSGKYWSSELRPDMCFEAYQIWISYNDSLSDLEGKSTVSPYEEGYRENGRSVRAVVDKKQK